jgi:hypothetical protein
MCKLINIVLAIIAVGQTPQARAQQNLGGAGYMLPLCNAWLKIAEKDAEAIKNILRADPVRLTTARMCAGEVIGIAETLRMLEMSCPPEVVTNEQIVRMAVNEIEKHPERLHKDFITILDHKYGGDWKVEREDMPVTNFENNQSQMVQIFSLEHVTDGTNLSTKDRCKISATNVDMVFEHHDALGPYHSQVVIQLISKNF